MKKFCEDNINRFADHALICYCGSMNCQNGPKASPYATCKHCACTPEIEGCVMGAVIPLIFQD